MLQPIYSLLSLRREYFHFIVTGVLVLGIIGHSHCQSASSCFNMDEIMRIQASKISESRSFLNRRNWSAAASRSDVWLDYYPYAISYTSECWKPNYYEPESAIYIYTKPGKPNMVILQASSGCFSSMKSNEDKKRKGEIFEESSYSCTVYKEGGVTKEFRTYNDYRSGTYSILIYNTKALDAEIGPQKAEDEAKRRAEIIKQQELQNMLRIADSLYYAGDYNAAISKYEMSRYYSDDDSYANEQIRVCNVGIADRIAMEGDAYFAAGDYSSALARFSEALTYNPGSTALQQKKTSAQRKLNQQIAGRELLKGDSLFDLHLFLPARISYNKVVSIDPANTRATAQIAKIDNILTVLRDRKTTVYSYQSLLPSNFYSFRSAVINSIDSLSAGQREGKVNFDFSISFDTSGHNTSNYTIQNTTTFKLPPLLESYKSNPLLTPTIMEGYYVASKESFGINFSWFNKSVMYKCNSRKVKSRNNEENSQSDKVIRNYINNQYLKQGKYQFQVKSKTFNGRTYTDISLVKYKIAGPVNCFYSLILPGLGSLKVTYGKKGIYSMIGFACFTGGAIYYRILSNQYYQNYSNASAQADIDSFYKKANDAHHIALALGTVSFSIYVYDFFRAFAVGCNNKRKTRFLRRQLRHGPVILQSQPFSLN